MKKFVLAAFAALSFACALAQDTIPKPPQPPTPPVPSDSTMRDDRPDTIRFGGITIIRDHGRNDTLRNHRNERFVISKNKRKRSNVETNWWIFDLGLSSFNDKTDYASAPTQAFAPGATEDQFELRTGKSVNVNVWFFMQKTNLIKHVVNLKYGLGLELNNYRFSDERLTFTENPTQAILATDKGHKNKLAVDYLTVPLMLNFDFTPKGKGGFGFSGGVSAGYRYSARQKFKDDGDVSKTKDDFDLEKWKLQYIGELQLGPVKLYGSYAMNNMWERGLDWRPYNIGLRFSNF